MTDDRIVVLKNDPALGLYVCIDAADVESLCAWLDDEEIRYDLAPEGSERVAEPGTSVFSFGQQHRLGIRDLLEDYGIQAEVDPGIALSEQAYGPPLDRLLRAGKLPREGEKGCYAKMGIGREHVPDLIRMATDEALHTGPEGSQIVWAPVHAWRALAEFRAEESIGPLLGLLCRIDEENDDWVGEDVPDVLAEIGPAAVGPLALYLGDPAHGEWARVAAAHALALIGEHHPDARDKCASLLCAQLGRFASQSDALNAFLVLYLVDLKAVEAASVMERAFAAGRVDETVDGDWEDAQVALGLKSRREHARKPNRLTVLGDRLRAALESNGGPVPSEEPLIPAEQGARMHLPEPRTKIGRNDPCPCGSGRKYKKCCGIPGSAGQM